MATALATQDDKHESRSPPSETPVRTNEEAQRYWRSMEALEPVFKHVGLRKRLSLARVNKDVQEIVYSWLRRHQRKLVLMCETCRGYRHLLAFVPGYTLYVTPKSSEQLSKLLDICSNLCLLHIEDKPLVSTIMGIARTCDDPTYLKTPSEIIPRGAVKLPDPCLQDCIYLMNMMPNLKEIFALGRHQGWDTFGERGFLFAIERSYEEFTSSRLLLKEWNRLSGKNLKDLKDQLQLLAGNRIKAIKYYGMSDRGEDLVKVRHVLSSFPALEVFELEYQPWDIEKFCKSISASTCDHLVSFSLIHGGSLDRSSALMLSDTASKRWPSLKCFDIGYHLDLTGNDICELINRFKNLETLTLEYSFRKDQISSLPPNSIKELNVMRLEQAVSIINSMPLLRKLFVSDPHELDDLSKITANFTCNTLECLEFKHNIRVSSLNKCESQQQINEIASGFRRLLQSFPNLRYLCLQFTSHPRLSELQRKCFYSIMSEECPRLEKLYLECNMNPFKPEYFKKILPRLKYLGVDEWDWSSLESGRYILDNSPKLRVLQIITCRNMKVNEISSVIDAHKERNPDFIFTQRESYQYFR